MILPTWVEEIRPHQHYACAKIVSAFDQGAKVVLLDAPTGSGKTLIAEMVRQSLTTRGLYICSTLNLQEQFASDFHSAMLLRGRSNYPSLDHPSATAADCSKEKTHAVCPSCPPDDDHPVRMHCRWCHPVSACPYEQAKSAAMRSDLVCTNLAYFLNEANYVGNISHNRGLIVVDEADLLEDALLDFISVTVSPRQLKDYHLDPPTKRTVESVWLSWATDSLRRVDHLLRHGIPDTDLSAQRRRRHLRSLQVGLQRLLHPNHGIAGGNWVYTGYDQGAVVFKPIRVDQYARDFVWRHGTRFLLMSATTISFAAMAETLGIECSSPSRPLSLPLVGLSTSTR